MAHFYKGYRVESPRLQAWDYRTPAHYFVTFNTQHHRCWLGKIIDGESYVSRIGLMLAEEWLRTPSVRANVMLDLWVVMPNHFHGILIITDQLQGTAQPANPEEEHPQAGALGTIVGQVKSAVTRRVRDLGEPGFAWQERFHDHIIRDEQELDHLREYIVCNPGKWHEDRYYRPET